MNTTVIALALNTTVIALILAITGPIGAYLVAAKRFSGKIASSDAAELWSESRSIREWSQHQMETLNVDVRRLQEQVIDLSLTIVRLREELTVAREDLRTARDRVAELEKEVNGKK